MIFWASLRKEILEQIRTKRLMITIILLVVFAMLSPVMAKYMPEIFKAVPGAEQFAALMPTPTIKDAIDQYVKNTSQFAIILALLLPMGAVALEKDKGTAAMMLVKPLPRWIFLLTKFLALGFTFLIGIALAGMMGYLYTWYLFAPMNLGAWVAINLMLWLYVMVYVAMTLLFSTLVRSQAAAAGMSFGVLIVLSIIGSIPTIAKHLPAQLVVWSGELMMGAGTAYWSSLVVSVGIVVGSYCLAWWVFRRQEL
jgi:ABC-2 type transport system permease protein